MDHLQHVAPKMAAKCPNWRELWTPTKITPATSEPRSIHQSPQSLGWRARDNIGLLGTSTSFTSVPPAKLGLKGGVLKGLEQGELPGQELPCGCSLIYSAV